MHRFRLGVNSATFWGPPDDAKLLGRLLGSGEGPLDRVVDVPCGEETRRWPVWRAIFACTHHELDVARLAATLEASQLPADARRAVLDELLATPMGGWKLRWPRPGWAFLPEGEQQAKKTRLEADVAALVTAIEADLG